ncbi:crosslink repair DNA glycosylase YcaQ family protein [Actinopolymorpha sp. B17G11]|uniref:DNA glycosylase AlkZ-like family protein n=1 Tax=Actinopolymorpha sp. B17G11 TaxID=3160861 RepID=UPI0032E3F7AA
MAAYLRRQLLGQTFTGTPVEVVEAVAGLNAQTPRAPSAGLWTRLASFDQDDLDRALRSYLLVKANLMRGTVHMVTRRQYVTWRLSLQPMLERTVNGFCPGLWRTVDHDKLLRRGARLLREHDGLTRAEISAELGQEFPLSEPRQLGFAVRMLLPVVQVADDVSWRPARSRYILAEQAFDDVAGSRPESPARASGSTTSGAAVHDQEAENGEVRPANARFSPLDHEPETPGQSGELLPAPQGLPDLVRSFLRAFGPASNADASYWSGVSRLAPVLTSVGTPSVGRPAESTGPARGTWYDATQHIDEEPRRCYVLPEYDNVYFCRKGSESPLVSAKKRLVGPVGHMTGSLVSAGEVCAQWKWTVGAGTVTLTPWRDLDTDEATEFERFRAWCSTIDAATTRRR